MCDPDMHDFELRGMLGPYPTEVCRKCGCGALCAVPGYPRPIEVLLAALERAGCNPQPIDE